MENELRPLNLNNNNSKQGDDMEQQPPPTTNMIDHPPRSIDDYLESAYTNSNNGVCHYHRGGVLLDMLQHWRYYIIFLALGIANSGDSAEMGCTNYILSSETFQHDILGEGDDAAEGGAEIDFAKRGAAIAGAHFAGMIISGLLSGVLADVWGRRSTLLAGLLCNSAVGILSATARNATELCLLRFTCGIGLGMVIAGVVTLAAEMSPPSKRGRFMTLVASCYTLGFLYTAFWALIIFKGSGSGNWRLFMFMNALPTIVAASLVLMFVPESPRFFLCRGKVKEAVCSANFIMSRIGYVDKLLTEEEVGQYLLQAKNDVGQANSNVRSTEEVVNHPNGAMEIMKEVCYSLSSLKQPFMRGIHRRTIPLQFTYFSLTLVTGVTVWWTKIFQNLDLQTDAYALSFYSTLAQIPGMMLASTLIDWVGRRQLVIIGFGGASSTLILLSMMANIIQQHNAEKDEEGSSSSGGGAYHSIIVLGLACFYTIFLCIAWLSLDCLSAESFPTKIRSTGRGVCTATGRAAGLCVQFLYGPLISENRLGYMLGLASVFAIGGVAVSYQTTDTTNVDLQDHWDYSTKAGGTSDDIDGKGSNRTSFADTTHMD